MKLDLGGLETIESPTEEDVRHCLKDMGAESPFVVLSDRTGFIQTICAGAGYQVEYSMDNGRHLYSYCVDYETACELFLNFLAGKTAYQTRVPWKRTWYWKQANHPITLVVIATLAALVFGGVLWLTLR